MDYRFERLENAVWEGDEVSSYHTDKKFTKPESSEDNEPDEEEESESV